MLLQISIERYSKLKFKYLLLQKIAIVYFMKIKLFSSAVSGTKNNLSLITLIARQFSISFLKIIALPSVLLEST